MSLNYEFKNERPAALTEQIVFDVGCLLMIVGVSEVNDSTIPIIVNRLMLDMAICGNNFGTESNLSGKVTLCNGMKVNVTNETTQQFIKRKMKYHNARFDIPKKAKINYVSNN